MSDDEKRVRELLARDHLEGWEVRELDSIVGRNQNDGVFDEAEWIALRGWAKAELDRMHLRRQARGALVGADEAPATNERCSLCSCDNCPLCSCTNCTHPSKQEESTGG